MTEENSRVNIQWKQKENNRYYMLPEVIGNFRELNLTGGKLWRSGSGDLENLRHTITVWYTAGGRLTAIMSRLSGRFTVRSRLWNSGKKSIPAEAGSLSGHAENERDPQYFGAQEIDLPEGEHILDIRVMNFETFPALYVEGVVETDETWEVDDMSLDYQPAAAWDVFDTPEKRPDIFPFKYEPVEAVSSERMEDGGVLFDFGKETFAKVRLFGLKDREFRIRYGESREEALDAQWSVTRFTEKPD